MFFSLTPVTDPKFVLFKHLLGFARIMSTLCPNSCRQTARIGGGGSCPPCPPSRTPMCGGAGSLFCTLKPAAFSSFFYPVICICYFNFSCDRHLGLYYVSGFYHIVLLICAFAVFSGWPEINFYYYYYYYYIM